MGLETFDLAMIGMSAPARPHQFSHSWTCSALRTKESAMKSTPALNPELQILAVFGRDGGNAEPVRWAG